VLFRSPDYNDPWSKKGIYSLSEGYMYYGSRNDGAFAEYLSVKALNLIKLGDNVPYDWGATIDPAANAVHACLRADLTERIVLQYTEWVRSVYSQFNMRRPKV